MSTSHDRSDLHGKVAVITGASSGIGRATARALDDAGMTLVLVARSEAKLLSIAEKLKAASVLALDVTDPSASEGIIRFAEETFGGLDVLINNAGMMAIGDVDDLNLEKATAMVRLNVEATFRLSILAARSMKTRRQGFIINVSSVAGIKTARRMSVYNGTKFAVEGFTDALRMELAEFGVRVGCIEPGTVDTALYGEWSVVEKKMISELGALAAEDIARSIRFMLEQPAHMTVARLFALPSGQGI